MAKNLIPVTMSVDTIDELTSEDLAHLRLAGIGTNQGENVRIGIIDTGIYDGHKEFDGVTIEKVSATYYGDGTDDNGHGTHCASKLVGRNVGLAKKCTYLCAIKALDAMGSSEAEYIIKAFQMALDYDLDILSCSIGMDKAFFTDDEFTEFKSAIDALVDAGVTIFVACGNGADDGTVYYPAGFDNVISVGAVDEDFAPAYFTEVADYTDICQVGVDVIGAYYKQVDGEDVYIKMSGTSMATPIAASFGACMISKYAAALEESPNVDILTKCIKLQAIDVNTDGWDDTTGAGFVTFKDKIDVITIENVNANVIKATISSGTATCNGEEFDLEAAPVILYDASQNLNKTMVEARTIVEEANGIVDYSNGTLTITI